jgi:hypothetical protein
VNGRPDGCVPLCVAAMLAMPSLALSLPTGPEARTLARLNDFLGEQAGCFLASIPSELLPWREPDVDWIAGIDMDGEGHAVVACGEWVAFDPAGVLQPGAQLPEVETGWLLLPYPRAIRLHRIERIGELADKGRVTIGCDT